MPVLANTVTDSHLVSRDRLGRLVTFMARTIVDGWVGVEQARAIGVGGRAALLIEDGVARVAGDGAVYLLRPRDAEPVTCGDDASMPFGSVEVHRLDARVSAFSIDAWATLWEEGTPGYELSLDQCRSLTPPGDIEQIY
jgi:cyanophycinase-like exopeptidase